MRSLLWGVSLLYWIEEPPRVLSLMFRVRIFAERFLRTPSPFRDVKVPKKVLSVILSDPKAKAQV